MKIVHSIITKRPILSALSKAFSFTHNQQSQMVELMCVLSFLSGQNLGLFISCRLLALSVLLDFWRFGRDKMLFYEGKVRPRRGAQNGNVSKGRKSIFVRTMLIDKIWKKVIEKLKELVQVQVQKK